MSATITQLTFIYSLFHLISLKISLISTLCKIHISEKPSSWICEDTNDCTNVTANLCKTFSSIRESCAATCRSCKCEDSKNCTDVTEIICANYPSVREKCHKTCGVCKDPGLLFFIIFKNNKKYFLNSSICL